MSSATLMLHENKQVENVAFNYHPDLSFQDISNSINWLISVMEIQHIL
jgi:hypothetical protein